MRRSANTVIAAAFIAGLVGPVAAQEIPPGQSCGGLLCDMGVLGRKVPLGPDGAAPSDAQMAAAEAADPHHLPCNDFVCRAFGGNKEAEAAPPAPAPVEPMKAETAPMKKKHHAKVAARTAAPSAGKSEPSKAETAPADPAAR